MWSEVHEHLTEQMVSWERLQEVIGVGDGGGKKESLDASSSVPLHALQNHVTLLQTWTCHLILIRTAADFDSAHRPTSRSCSCSMSTVMTTTVLISVSATAISAQANLHLPTCYFLT